jgi:hypothetical protein
MASQPVEAVRDDGRWYSHRNFPRSRSCTRSPRRNRPDPHRSNVRPANHRHELGLLGPVGFDLDMTLIDARPAVMDAFELLAQGMRVEIDLGEVDRRFGINLEDELGHWFPPADTASAAEVFVATM